MIQLVCKQVFFNDDSIVGFVLNVFLKTKIYFGCVIFLSIFEGENRFTLCIRFTSFCYLFFVLALSIFVIIVYVEVFLCFIVFAYEIYKKVYKNTIFSMVNLKIFSISSIPRILFP